MELEQRHKITQRVTLTGAAVNCALASLQIIFGLLGKSQALLADGFHTLSDLSTDFIVLYASRRAAKAADEDHPYGHGRIETLASMLLGGILVTVGVGIGLRGVDSILNPYPCFRPACRRCEGGPVSLHPARGAQNAFEPA
jgi:cation diffusion facilitator family transporter